MKKKNKPVDEYNNIFGSGFEFTYNNRKLSKSRLKPKSEMDELLPGGPDLYPEDSDVPVLIVCKQCGMYMIYQDGKWLCPGCETKVRESTVYLHLDRENEEFLNTYLADDYDDVW